MNYGLAKQLKDAGFSQKGGQSFYHQNIWLRHLQRDQWYPGTREPLLELPNHGHDGNYDFGVLSPQRNWDWANHIYCPTLEELIEACGKQFDKLELWGTDHMGEQDWVAWFGQHDDGINFKNFGRGSTPAEAVARLWLALNKK